MKAPKLPSSLSDVWPGGFAVPNPCWIRSVAAAGGTVLAGGEQIYLLRPGATRFASRPLPTGVGDAVAVGVDPRCRGRMAVACAYGLVLFEGKNLAVARTLDRASEFAEVAWGPATGKRGSDLYILNTVGTVLRLSPGAPGFEQLDLPPVRAMTCDEKGQLTYACFDEDDWSLDVHVHTESGLEITHVLEAPAAMSYVYLARAGEALAVGFEDGGVWLTRRVTEPRLSCVESLSGGPVAFQGPDAAGALFGLKIEEKVRGLIRVDANGAAARIGELEMPETEKLRRGVEQLAWDATRKTLWAAVGRAGVLASTAPGAPLPGAGVLS